MHRTTLTLLLLLTWCTFSSHGFPQHRQCQSSSKRSPLRFTRQTILGPTIKPQTLDRLGSTVRHRASLTTEVDDEETTEYVLIKDEDESCRTTITTTPEGTQEGDLDDTEEGEEVGLVEVVGPDETSDRVVEGNWEGTMEGVFDGTSDATTTKSQRNQIAAKFRALTEIQLQQDQFLLALAVLPSIVAFFAWKDLSSALSNFLDTYGVARLDIDGTFANNLLRPTITGVVVPVIAIALATLVSTTINVLRDREVQLRTLINKESCDLYLLRQAVFGLFGTRQHASRRARALALLCSYVQQLKRESSLGALEELQELQLSGGIAANELNQFTQMLHGIDGAAASRQGTVGYADDLVRSLNDYRSERVAELLSGFPAIHWGVLIALSLSVCTTFLLASNQPMNEYLNSLTLRILFATLVGVCSGTATLCINLADPFRGTFSILDASAQLEELRLLLEKDVAEASAEAGEIASSLVYAILLGEWKEDSSIDSAIANPSVQQNMGKLDTTSPSGVGDFKNKKSKTRKEPRRYGIVPTIYFHLLTGPFGSNVKALGDVIAWLATFLTSQTKAFSQRVTAIWRRRWARRRNATTSTTPSN